MSKKIWARIGITLEVSDEQYWELRNRLDEKGHCQLSEKEGKLWQSMGVVDGDCYIPDEEFEWAELG